ncbi:hypothetical protein ABHA96_02035 [Ligilactobacillus ruminis]|uniref:hypothetical protein n=1 Tax=Ligilactobacillus ruminis TaxID=1623 RepID=UPI00325BC042
MLIEQALHLAKSPSFTDTLMKMEPLSINLSEILDRSVEQYCRLKKVFFSWRIKKDEQSQSQLDLLRSSFRLIQAENGTFFPASFLFAYF